MYMDYNNFYNVYFYIKPALEQPTAVVNCSQPIIVTEGDNVSCLCGSQGGNPPPTASWSRNGKEIGGYGYLKKTLSLKNVFKDDSGNYTCTVRSHNLGDSKSIGIIIKCKFFFVYIAVQHV